MGMPDQLREGLPEQEERRSVSPGSMEIPQSGAEHRYDSALSPSGPFVDLAPAGPPQVAHRDGDPHKIFITPPVLAPGIGSLAVEGTTPGTSEQNPTTQIPNAAHHIIHSAQEGVGPNDGNSELNANRRNLLVQRKINSVEVPRAMMPSELARLDFADIPQTPSSGSATGNIPLPPPEAAIFAPDELLPAHPGPNEQLRPESIDHVPPQNTVIHTEEGISPSQPEILRSSHGFAAGDPSSGTAADAGVDGPHIDVDSPTEKLKSHSGVNPISTVIKGANHAVTSLEVRYLQRNPIGTVAIRRGARTIVRRGVPALALEEFGHITAQMLGSGLGGPAVQTAVNASTEGLVAPLIGYGAYKIVEGTARALRPRAVKRYWAGRRMAREDRIPEQRETTMLELAAEAQKRSVALQEEARHSPERIIDVDAFFVGDGPHGIEVKSVIHERGGRNTRVVSAERNSWIGGGFGEATTLFYYLNTSTEAARLGVGLFHNRGRSASLFAPGFTFSRRNPAAMALDAARNRDDMGKGVKIYDRSPSDAGHMNPSHVSEFAQGPNPRSDEKHLENMRNSSYAGPTMLGVNATEILDDEASGGFLVPVVDAITGEKYNFRARAVIDATGQGKENDELKKFGPDIYTSTEFLQDPEPIMQAIFNGQSVGIVGGFDSGSIAMEGIIALVRTQREMLDELRESLPANSANLPEITRMQEQLRNVKIHLFGARFGDRDEFRVITTNRYKATLERYIQFPEYCERDRTITIYPHQGYVYPHEDHTYAIKRSPDNLPVIDGEEFGAVVTAIGRVPSTLYYNGTPLSEQTETVHQGMHGLALGERVPGKRIYVVGTKADIPFRKEDPDQWFLWNAIKRRIPRLKPEDFFVTSQWEKRWIASLDRLIPRSTEFGILIEKELNDPALIQLWNKLARRR